jgi:uncharacterized protein DUF3303
MKFMVEFRLNPGSKQKVIETFELVGPNRQAGVAFRNAWIGTRSDVVFVLVESAEEALVAKAAQAWNEQGESRIEPVLDVEQV